MAVYIRPRQFHNKGLNQWYSGRAHSSKLGRSGLICVGGMFSKSFLDWGPNPIPPVLRLEFKSDFHANGVIYFLIRLDRT